MRIYENLYIIEILTEWGWIKQETIYTSYEKAKEVCEKIGLESNQYHIIKCKKKKKIRFFKNFLKNYLHLAKCVI